jgi:hypothetical protein
MGGRLLDDHGKKEGWRLVGARNREKAVNGFLISGEYGGLRRADGKVLVVSFVGVPAKEGNQGGGDGVDGERWLKVTGMVVCGWRNGEGRELHNAVSGWLKT